MNKVFIGLGSNLGEGLDILSSAWRKVGEHQQVVAVALSSPYLSSPVGMESSNWFTNAVGELETSLTARQTLKWLFEVEKEFGRRRKPLSGYQDRTLDLDILFFNDIIVDDRDLIIPHPEMGKRLFVLKPLVELLSKTFLHPVTSQSLGQMLNELEERNNKNSIEKQIIFKKKWPAKIQEMRQ